MTEEELDALLNLYQRNDVPKMETEEKKTVENDTIIFEVQFNGMTYAGTYHGDTVEGVPHGVGRFEGNADEKELLYDGSWDNACMKGEGLMYADVYCASFSDEEGDYNIEGSYDGQVLNGKPEGKGTFVAVDAEGREWMYTGEWKNGSFNGEGMQGWVDDKTSFRMGTFVNGIFSPKWSEIVYYLGTMGTMPYEVSESAMAFMEKYPQFFLDASRYDIATSTTVSFKFNLKQFKKNPMGEKAALIKLNDMWVAQARTESVWDVGFEYILFMAEDGTIYHGIRYGESDIVEGMQVSMYYLPLDWITYETVNGEKKWSVMGVISSYITTSYDALKPGSSGSDVLMMKKRLQELGYFSQGASLSASYNTACKERVMQFQQANGLPATGIADSVTLSVLYSGDAVAKPQ